MVVLVGEILGIGWLLGLGVGIAGLVIGQGILRTLVRLRVPWWPSVAGGLLVLGPAAGLLVGAWVSAGTTGAVAFGSGDATVPARLGWSLVLFFAASTAYGLVRSFLSSRLAQEELGIRIPGLIFDAGRLLLWIAMVFVVIVTVWHGRQVVMQVLAVAGLSTLVIGLALQETLKNFIAGMSIVIEGTYTIGDWIFIGEDEGEVLSITRRTTKIRNRMGDVVTVPNSLVTMGKVRNQSKPTPLHAEFVFAWAGHDAHPNQVRDVIREAVLEVPKVLREPAPVIRLARFHESGVEYEAKLWLSDVAAAPDIRSTRASDLVPLPPRGDPPPVPGAGRAPARSRAGRSAVRAGRRPGAAPDGPVLRRPARGAHRAARRGRHPARLRRRGGGLPPGAGGRHLLRGGRRERVRVRGRRAPGRAPGRRPRGGQPLRGDEPPDRRAALGDRARARGHEARGDRLGSCGWRSSTPERHRLAEWPRCAGGARGGRFAMRPQRAGVREHASPERPDRALPPSTDATLRPPGA
jgi:small-conductance mechanosensitive channel